MILHLIQVRDLEKVISSEREAHRNEIVNIITKKDAEIVEVKMEAARTTAGLKKIYESLKVPWLVHFRGCLTKQMCSAIFLSSFLVSVLVNFNFVFPFYQFRAIVSG